MIISLDFAVGRRVPKEVQRSNIIRQEWKGHGGKNVHSGSRWHQPLVRYEALENFEQKTRKFWWAGPETAEKALMYVL